jgi:hypothetical protein
MEAYIRNKYKEYLDGDKEQKETSQKIYSFGSRPN